MRKIKMTSITLFRDGSGEVVGALMRPLSKKYWRLATGEATIDVYDSYENFRNSPAVYRVWDKYNLSNCIKEEYKGRFTDLMEGEDGIVYSVKPEGVKIRRVYYCGECTLL